jgi:hypothetical protein
VSQQNTADEALMKYETMYPATTENGPPGIPAGSMESPDIGARTGRSRADNGLKNAGAFPDLCCTMEVFASVKAALNYSSLSSAVFSQFLASSVSVPGRTRGPSRRNREVDRLPLAYHSR